MKGLPSICELGRLHMRMSEAPYDGGRSNQAGTQLVKGYNLSRPSLPSFGGSAMTGYRHLEDIWPAALESLDLSVHLLTDELDFEGLSKTVAKTEGFTVSPTRITGTVRPRDEDGDFHGHFLASKRNEHKGFTLRLEIVPGTAKKLGPPAPDVYEFSALLNKYLKPTAGGIRGVLWARFRYPTDKYSPTVTLPIVVPGVLQDLDKSPVITGLDFSFTDKSQPLRRAYVGRHEEEGAIFIQLTLSHEIKTLRNLPTVLCEEAATLIRPFIRPLAAKVTRE